LVNAAAPRITSCTFHNNTNSSGNGGAINAAGVSGDLEIQRSVFTDNSANGHGGALRVNMNQGSRLLLRDSLFENNETNLGLASGSYVGGAIWLESGDIIISNTPFRGNRSNSHSFRTEKVTAAGGAIYVSSGSLNITSSEFINNKARGDWASD